MKKLLVLFIVAILFSCEPVDHNPLENVRSFMVDQADSMFYHANVMKVAILNDEPPTVIQNHFSAARKNYKRIECLSEFYFPNMSEFINGPALDESEEYDDKVIEATGFQVIEEFVFPEFDTAAKNDVLQEIEILLSAKVRFIQLVKDNRLSDQNIFESVRLQLLRIISLGISGFDSPVAQHSIAEAKASLQGIEQIMLLTHPKPTDPQDVQHLLSLFNLAYQFLDENKDFMSFDRAHFIRNHILPISKAIYDFQKNRMIANNKFAGALNMNESNFFSENIFNASFFNSSLETEPNQATVELGKTLFFDPILSGNNKRSCASCHQPSNGFADARQLSTAFDLSGKISRNTPTLINSGFQRSQFWDQRVQFIKDQVADVIENHEEMHGDIKKTFGILMTSLEYRHMFKKAFPDKDSADHRDIKSALAAYLRSLQSLNSNFDLYMQGDTSKLEEEGIRGFNLFMGKAKCATCHFLPLFNGTVPPAYMESEAEVLGVPEAADTTGAKPDDDLGKYNAYRRKLFQNAFKTPTVRNAALTGPYMHNGVYSTLEEVVDFYNRGGGAGIGVKLENQTLPENKLGLTKEEQNHIIAFIHALTDTTGLTSIPKRLPSFEDKALNDRIPGGTY